LPPSGITKVDYPEEFPSLPPWTSFSSVTSPNDSNTASDINVLANKIPHLDEEQSWYYYLAEIALRKQANSIIDLLYRRGELDWMENAEYLLRQAPLRESELDHWYSLLPPNLRFNADKGTSNELAFLLECRQLQWRQIAYRPLLYYALHRSDTDSYFHRVLPLAQKCLEYAALMIRRQLRQHYHAGTWYSQRSIASCTLLILSAQLRGLPLYVPDWRSLISLSLRALALWEADAQDLGQARVIIETILNKMSPATNEVLLHT